MNHLAIFFSGCFCRKFTRNVNEVVTHTWELRYAKNKTFANKSRKVSGRVTFCEVARTRAVEGAWIMEWFVRFNWETITGKCGHVYMLSLTTDRKGLAVLCFDLWNLLKANVKFKTNNSWPNQIGCISQPSPAWQPRLVAARLMRDSRYLSRLSIAVNYLFPSVFTSWIVALFLWRFDVVFFFVDFKLKSEDGQCRRLYPRLVHHIHSHQSVVSP